MSPSTCSHLGRGCRDPGWKPSSPRVDLGRMSRPVDACDPSRGERFRPRTSVGADVRREERPGKGGSVMARSRPTAIAYAKLALVLAFITAIAFVRVPARAAPGGNADLSITGSTSSPGVKVGHDLAFTLKAQNHGPDAATNVTVEVVLDPDVPILAADASGG